MSVRKTVSRIMFRKNRALRYPVNVVKQATGAPSGAASTKAGVLFYSVATKGTYLVESTGTSALLGDATLVSTATA